MRIHNRKSMKDIRRHLRHSLTPAEAALWKALQGSKLEGKKFRRQHSIGNYVVDFYCPECKLAIELDGEKHFNSIASEYDLRRNEFLSRYNVRVLRFENRAVFEHPDGVLEAIKSHLANPTTTPLPLLNQEGSTIPLLSEEGSTIPLLSEEGIKGWSLPARTPFKIKKGKRGRPYSGSFRRRAGAVATSSSNLPSRRANRSP